MQKEKRFSDEFLNSFVDNQLAPDEKSRAYVEISADPEINQQVCELRKLRDLVQLAYRDVPAPPARQASPAGPGRRKAGSIAAAVILAIGIGVGLKIELPERIQQPVAITAPAGPAVAVNRASNHRVVADRTAPATARVSQMPAAPTRAERVAAILESGTPQSINDVHIGNVRNKVLIHIAHDDQERLAQALDEIDGLMKYYQETRQSAHVEVVINGRGMELVRRDTSAHAARIAQLQKEYNNLTFAACQNTIDRLKREDGIDVRLLPGVVITDSGMAEIMRRQHQGWTYLQV